MIDTPLGFEASAATRRARRWLAPLCVLAGLGVGVGNAFAVDVASTVLNGGMVTVGGDDPYGNGYSGGVGIHGDPMYPGTSVSPLVPDQWYDFAAPGNVHDVAATATGNWPYATASMSVDVAPAGSSGNGLAVNHAHFDFWVSDNPDGYGRGAQGDIESQSNLLTDQTQFYGAMHWQVIGLPNPHASPTLGGAGGVVDPLHPGSGCSIVTGSCGPAISLAPGATGSIDINLLYQPFTVHFGPTGTASGDITDFTAGPSPRRWGSYDTNMRFAPGAGIWACGAIINCSHGGGRFLIDVWWAFSDSPINPLMLIPVPEPQVWAQMLAGLVGIAGLARRRVARARIAAQAL